MPLSCIIDSKKGEILKGVCIALLRCVNGVYGVIVKPGKTSEFWQRWKHGNTELRDLFLHKQDLSCSVETLILHYVKVFALVMNHVNIIKAKIVKAEVENVFLS